MKFWIYGNDTKTGESRHPLFVEADHERAVREEARRAGMEITEIKRVANSPAATRLGPLGELRPIQWLAPLIPILSEPRHRRLVAAAIACLFITAIGIFPPRSRVVSGSVTHERVSRGFLFANLLPQSKPSKATLKGHCVLSPTRMRMVSLQNRRHSASTQLCRTEDGTRCRIDVGRALCEAVLVLGMIGFYSSSSLIRESRRQAL